MQSSPLLEWPHVGTELVGFLGAFATAGAIGFRYVVARAGWSASPTVEQDERAILLDAARRAAVVGLVGALIRVALLLTRLPELAERRHVTVAQLVTGTFQTGAQVALLALTVIGFALAAARRAGGWPLAAVGVIGFALLPALTGDWERVATPLHVLGGGLWIGTLFVLVVAALPAVVRSDAARGRRDDVLAHMVHAFSPLALGSAAAIAVLGVVLAWEHLPSVAALWTTPYGRALLAKLAVVAVVVGLGAWNWRRVGPTLGTGSATAALRRSASAELTAAGVVLVLSAVLVSLPNPKRAAAPPTRGAAPGARQ